MTRVTHLSLGLVFAFWSASALAADLSVVSALQQTQLRTQSDKLKTLGTRVDDVSKKVDTVGTRVDDVNKKVDSIGISVGPEILAKAANPAALVIAGKWRLADTFNDSWLRIYDASGSNYYGGIAMNDLWVSTTSHLRGDIHMANDLQLQSNFKFIGVSTLRLWDVSRNEMGNLMAQRIVGNYISSPEFYGTLYGTVKSPSDRRLKDDIKPMPSSLARIKSLQPRTYTWKDKSNKAPGFGFIAQELETVYPELVDQNSEGTKAVNYSMLVAPLVKAVQEQQAQIEALTQKIEALEKGKAP